MERDPTALPTGERPPDGYRQLAAVVEEIRAWDVILIFGEVKLIGIASSHLRDCWHEQRYSGRCHCFDSPRLTSPVVDAWTRPLRESRYDGDPVTGAARHLLTLDAGDEVTVLSGKAYRIVGPRKTAGYDGFASGSIFRVYAEEDAKSAATPWWRKVLARISGRGRCHDGEAT